MRTDAILAFATRSRFSISECEELAKDLDAYNTMTFDLVGPKGRKACRWLDAYYGIFQMEGSEGAFQTSQFKYADDLHCENLEPHLPASADKRGDSTQIEAPSPMGSAVGEAETPARSRQSNKPGREM